MSIFALSDYRARNNWKEVNPRLEKTLCTPLRRLTSRLLTGNSLSRVYTLKPRFREQRNVNGNLPITVPLRPKPQIHERPRRRLRDDVVSDSTSATVPFMPMVL